MRAFVPTMRESYYEFEKTSFHQKKLCKKIELRNKSKRKVWMRLFMHGTWQLVGAPLKLMRCIGWMVVFDTRLIYCYYYYYFAMAFEYSADVFIELGENGDQIAVLHILNMWFWAYARCSVYNLSQKYASLYSFLYVHLHSIPEKHVQIIDQIIYAHIWLAWFVLHQMLI